MSQPARDGPDTETDPPSGLASLASMQDDSWIGRLVAGRYRIDRFLDAGGMGAIFLATEVEIDRPCILKVLHPELSDNPSKVERFRREARAVARLGHPSIVQVYFHGQTEEGLLYLAMEYVPGQNLSDLLETAGAIPPARALKLIEQVADALVEAHEAHIVHRDLKPGNIMVCDDDVVKVLDFGIAKLLDSSEQVKLTQTGSRLGTPAYMAPEQIRGQAIDHRADLYAVGLILFEMLCGRRAFEANTPMEYYVRHLNAEVQAPTKVCPKLRLPAAVDQLIVQCLAKEVDARPASAQTVLDTIACARRTVGTPRAQGTALGRVSAIASLLLVAVGVVAIVMLLRPGEVNPALSDLRVVNPALSGIQGAVLHESDALVVAATSASFEELLDLCQAQLPNVGEAQLHWSGEEGTSELLIVLDAPNAPVSAIVLSPDGSEFGLGDYRIIALRAAAPRGP